MNRHPLPWLLGSLLLLAVGRTHAAPPDWVLDAARQPTPSLAADVPALVLLDETVYTVEADCRMNTRHRRVVRMLTRAGLGEAAAQAAYVEKSDSVQGCTAWLIRAGKVVKTVPQREWVDLNLGLNGSVYDEYRTRAASLTGETVVGDVFGFETNVEGPLLFREVEGRWAERYPALVHRIQLQIPAGWTVNALLKGPVTPANSVSADGRRFTWELRDRPYRPDEPATPARERLEATLLATLSPRPEVKAKAPAFGTWAEVLQWKNELNAGRCDSDPALAATVQKVTAGCGDNLARIRALARQVQALRYVEVAKGIGIGFGYRARKATEVNAKGWGDCKDKANLLCSMLHLAGFRAYVVYAFLEDGGEVYPDWPSPLQFNHAITAIEVDDSVQLPAVVATPRWGRLLFFDATDTDTVVGDLPAELQGSSVLVNAPGCSELTALPALPFDSEFLLERRVTLALAPSGAVTGKCSLGGTGQLGAAARRWIRTTALPDRRTKMIERLSDTLRGASVASVTANDDRDSGRCELVLEFSTPRFAQLLPGGMALVRLDVLSRDSVPTFSERERRMPVRIFPVIQRDDVTLELPAGLRPEELPAKAVLSGPYGAYENAMTAGDHTITQHRVLVLKGGIVPVEKYGELRAFLAAVAKADRTAVVLRKPE